MGYSDWIEAGNFGTEQDYRDSLDKTRGPRGPKGDPGPRGPKTKAALQDSVCCLQGRLDAVSDKITRALSA